jgi:TM2 domain-containing membrane protein YozV
MKCAVHTEADAAGFCRNCGKPMCPVCVRPVRDVLYCEDCLAGVMGMPPNAPPPQQQPANPQAAAADSSTNYYTDPNAALPPPLPVAQVGAGPNPALAFFLGFLPGLGAFYNEQFGKGIIHLAIFLFLFILGVDGAVNGGAEAALWLCIAGLWVYMPIDAYRTAKAKQAGMPLNDPLENFSKGKPIGPALIIFIGILLLLHNFDWFPWWRIQQFWPLILIALGIFMFRNRLGNRS